MWQDRFMVKGKLIQNSKGWAVEATEFIPAGSVIEVCPVIPIAKEKKHESMNQKQIARYAFSWNQELDCLVMGWGGVYNHDQNHNITYKPDVENLTMVYSAVRDIHPGEEMVINYGYCPTQFEWMNLVPQIFKKKMKAGRIRRIFQAIFFSN